MTSPSAGAGQACRQRWPCGENGLFARPQSGFRLHLAVTLPALGKLLKW